MIEINELRINNLVLYKGKFEHIRGTSAHHLVKLNDYANEYDVEEIDPIALTPEWLYRCGFIKTDRSKKMWYHPLVISFELRNVSALKDGFKVVAGRPMKSAFIGFSIAIRYVHHLQNIYFALTGAELELNLHP